MSRVLPAIAFVLAPALALAQTPEEFYRGRQITMLVGAGAGGGYDVYARVWAKHASRHIPGQPQIVAKNMPAAGGIAASNALFNNSDRDGSIFAALPNGVSMDPLAGVAQARYKPLEMAWIGSIGKLQNVCATWHTSPVKTIAHARERETVVAGAGATSNTAIMPRIINELLGTRFKVVAGYDPTGGLNMALERGEAEGICGLSWSTMKASRPHWIKDKLLNVIVQVGVEKLPDLPDVPSALELVKDAGSRQVLELVLIRQEIGRPLVLPPGVPADRVAAMRRAFEATLKDAAFLAEAAKSGMEIEPLSGPQIEAMLAKAYGAPAAVVARMVDLLKPSPSSGAKGGKSK
jgi:tripartite-type tricarboxylate transporter receptor subunit TctC